MRNVNTQQVVLILGLSAILMGGVVTLAAMGKDVGAIFGAVAAVAIGLAGAFGISLNHKVDQVKDIANGRLTEALDDGRKAREQGREDCQALQQQITSLAMLVTPPEQK